MSGEKSEQLIGESVLPQVIVEPLHYLFEKRHLWPSVKYTFWPVSWPNSMLPRVIVELSAFCPVSGLNKKGRQLCVLPCKWAERVSASYSEVIELRVTQTLSERAPLRSFHNEV